MQTFITVLYHIKLTYPYIHTYMCTKISLLCLILVCVCVCLCAVEGAFDPGMGGRQQISPHSEHCSAQNAIQKRMSFVATCHITFN